MSDAINIASDLVKKAKELGADKADAVMVESVDMAVGYRMQQQEELERAENQAIGLRVIIGKQQAIVSATDVSSGSLNELASRAISMARNAPEDEFSSFVETEQMVSELADLDLYDGKQPTAEQMQSQALAAEKAALDIEGITNSEGGSSSYARNIITMANSNGLAKSYRTSSSSLSVCVIAGEGTSMERDYDYTVACHAGDLRAAAEIGKKAAEKTLRRLNPVKIKTCEVPVVFDKEISRGLVGSLASALNGVSIAKGTSFLKDKMGQQVFRDNINIIDNPQIKRALGSKPCDGEGIKGEELSLIENGKLQNWILDLRSAKQLGLQTNGRASRGIGSSPRPSCTNLYMENGDVSFKDLIADIKEGFYVTDVFGMGVSTVTGDYSQGASGFWIKNGEIIHSVNELTIASNLGDMFLNMIAANDLEIKYSVNAPTLCIEKMTVASGD